MNKKFYGIGYLGSDENKFMSQNKRAYKVWHHMLERCYCEKYQARKPTYKKCTVSSCWHSFKNFCDWYNKNYADGLNLQLDKDLLNFKENKIYSPMTCVFLTSAANNFLKNRNKIKTKEREIKAIEIKESMRKLNIYNEYILSLIY